MKLTNCLVILASAVLATACVHDRSVQTADQGATAVPTPLPAPVEGHADLAGTANSKVKVAVSFKQDGSMTNVHIDASGLKPKSVHGLHIHEGNACVGPDFKSAGGHYNPMGEAHGAPDATTKHFGDLGNIKADKKGRIDMNIMVNEKMISGEKDASVIGKAMILHAGKDDLKSQPAGNSGDRIACGIITVVK